MSKRIETDLQTFIKFWLVPLGIIAVIFLIEKSITGLVIIGISIFLETSNCISSPSVFNSSISAWYDYRYSRASSRK